MYYYYIFASLLLTRVSPLPVEGDSTAREYLKRYGYLERVSDAVALTSEDKYKEALLLFKEYFHLPLNEEVDVKTLEYMQRPRCGIPDFENAYVTLGKWNKRVLRWHWYYNSRVNKDVIDSTKAAFALWEKRANITFVQEMRNSDILLSFTRGAHHYKIDNLTCSPFDQRGGVLAHAQFPSSDGRVREIHLDEAENWEFTLKRPDEQQTSLFAVLVHEIGHTLGIAHSDVEGSIMSPFYTFPDPFDLQEDDILAIEKLYGKKPNYTLTPTSTQPPSQPTEEDDVRGSEAPANLVGFPICTLSEIIEKDRGKHMDPSFVIIESQLYIMYGNYVWIRDLRHGHYDEYPRQINSWLSFLRQNRVLGAYQRPDGDIVLLTNGTLHVISSLTFQRKYTVPLKIPNLHVYNGIVNTNRGITYIFYNDYYYVQMEECGTNIMTHGTIKDGFPDAPAEFQSVFRYEDGRLYFIKHGQLYEYNEYRKMLVRVFPLYLSYFGIDCPNVSILRQLHNIVSNLLLK